MNLSFQFFLIILLLLASAFFSGIETGVVSIHRLRLKHLVRQGSKRAAILEGFRNDTDRLLSTTLVGNNLCTVLLSVIATSMGRRMQNSWGETVATAGATLILLLFGEYFPKAWFHSRPLDRCPPFARLLRLSEIILRPITIVILAVTSLIMPRTKKLFSEPPPFVTRDDLKILTREGEHDGVLSPRERFMIHRVFELSGKPASRIMIPRSRMVTVGHTTTITQFFEIARRIDYTRMPVFDPDKNVFTGILNVFFVLSYIGTNSSQPVGTFARPPLFVTEDMPVDDILPRMRRHRQPMCLVKDKAGEVTGLITTEDILQEIVGKL